MDERLMSMARSGLVALLIGSLPLAAFGQALDRLDRMPRQGTSDVSIRPVFSQIVLFSLPDEFVALAGGITRKGHYVQQAVPVKETPQRWTQRITLTGDEALAFSGRTYPQKIVDDEAARLKKTCPESFGAMPIAGVFVGSYETAAVVIGCGTTASAVSEATLHVVVKGGMDVYTLEWAVRGPPSRSPIRLDEAAWMERLRRLAPVRLCTIVPNEEPPFPSCLQRR